eukprot:4037384-Amphidinium_carterae.1
MSVRNDSSNGKGHANTLPIHPRLMDLVRKLKPQAETYQHIAKMAGIHDKTCLHMAKVPKMAPPALPPHASKP